MKRDIERPAFRTGLLRLAAATVIAALAGCASAPNQTAAVKPPDQPRAGYGSLHIGRPFGRNVSIFAVAVRVDGKALASLSPGHYTTVELLPGKHSIGVPDDTWNRAIAGTPHDAEFVVAAGKTYYALPTHWFESGGNRVTLVGSTAVVDRVAYQQVGFTVQEAAGVAPAEFGGLAYVATE